MTNHPNRNWRRRWIFEPPALVVHKSGVHVRFEPDQDHPGEWQGKCVAMPADIGTDARNLSRLMREAGDFFLENLKNAKN